jgi:TolB-like protein
MKNLVLPVFLLLASSGMLFASGDSDTGNMSGNTIDQAISYQGDYIVRRSPQDSSIAVVQITSSSENLSKYIIDELPNYIVGNTKEIAVVERQRLDVVENEVTYQLSGDVSDGEVVSIGERIGAKLVVTGSITQTGDTLRLNIKIIDVKTARLVGSNSYDVIIDDKVSALLSDKRQPDVPVTTETQPKRINNDFSSGIYIGYLYSPIAPFGFSIGRLEAGGTGLFVDTEFGFPSFEGYDSISMPTYDDSGRVGERGRYWDEYIFQGRSTYFVWEEIIGLNGSIWSPYFWFSLGAGLHFSVEHRLFQKYDIDLDSFKMMEADDDAEWHAPESPNFKFLMQAGLHFKLKHILFSLKYKYIFDVGSSFDLGIGYVWNISPKK